MNDYETPHERVCTCRPKDRRFYRFMAGVPGEPGSQGERGARGERGPVFVPAVDAAGNLSWTNDGGLPNPEAVNIRGPQGIPGDSGCFIAEYGETTTAELTQAWNAGRLLLLRDGGKLCTLLKTSEFVGIGRPSSIIFLFSGMTDYRTQSIYTCMDDLWSRETLAFDSPVRKGTISLGAVWDGEGLYSQRVSVPGVTVTASSKVDLQPDMQAIESLAGDGVEVLYVENSSGTLTAYAAGAAPPSAVTLQCTVTEVRA
ncbi:MAG: collagen-like protein [Oscillospiraceae bacterium]|nr:collagen-like protein [Oscillospiraceae bacterium]